MHQQATSVKLSRSAYRILFGVALSATGNGLVLPFFVVYLHQGRGLPTAVAGFVLSWMGITSLILAPVVGWLIDHYGPKPMLIVGLSIAALGYSLLGFITTSAQAFGAATFCAIGLGTLYPAQSSFVAEVTDEEQRERVFGISFALLNLGIGIGSIIASLVVRSPHVSSFTKLYVADGITYLLNIIVIVGIRGSGTRSRIERMANAEDSEHSSWRLVWQDRAFRRVWLVSFVAIFFGYSQLEVGFTAYATLHMHAKPEILAWAFAANTIVIATCQMWVMRRVKSRRRSTALALAAILWAASWGSVAIGGLTRFLAFLIIAQVIFALGEMVWSPVLPAVVNELAPSHLRGRYNAASGAAWQVGLILGPSMAGALLGAGADRLWLVLTVAGCTAAALMAVSLRKVLPKDEKINS